LFSQILGSVFWRIKGFEKKEEKFKDVERFFVLPLLYSNRLGSTK